MSPGDRAPALRFPSMQPLQLNDRIRVMFPSINKNDRIGENQARMNECFNINRCRIAKVLDVAPAEFDAIANEYLADRPDLWEQIGGAELPPAAEAEFRALAIANGIDPDSDFAAYQPPLIDFFRAHCVIPVVLLRAPGRPDQFINSEGYSYARYVGELFEPQELPACSICGAPAQHGIMDEALGQRFACAKHYLEVQERADRNYNELHNRVERIQGDLYEPGLDNVALALRVKAALRQLAPGAKWSVKAVRFSGVEAKLMALPPGQAAIVADGEEGWADQQECYVPQSERNWSVALGQLMQAAEAEADRFNARNQNSHLPGLDFVAYRIRVFPDYALRERNNGQLPLFHLVP
jgi:hypothetical protein